MPGFRCYVIYFAKFNTSTTEQELKLTQITLSD